MDNDLTAFEKIPVKIFDTSEQASKFVASAIASVIRSKEKEKKPCVLGLATGSTPTRVYAELVRMHKEEGLSFKNVHSFNLDEYYPIKPDAVQSYVRFMGEHLFNHIDIPKANIHIPDGTLPKEKGAEFCRAYEKQIDDLGGIDIQVLGIGRTGHIGFNEPGSS
ncbi:MAG TPA: 6-phosphogluconolactonase, partial [Chryseosolibacter sp.]|nr:6-phosphogluconolactonase [Chryseosolibacter sp.]